MWRYWPKQPTTKGPAERFTGDAWFDLIANGQVPSRIRVAAVRFTPGARTAWHAHAVGQTLLCRGWFGRVQSSGDAVAEVHPGQVIHTPPGEWHWHGAAPDRFMTHLAMWEAPAEGAESEWGALVTDDEYTGRA